MPFAQSGHIVINIAIFNGDYNDVQGNQDNRHTDSIETISSEIYLCYFFFFVLLTRPSADEGGNIQSSIFFKNSFINTQLLSGQHVY